MYADSTPIPESVFCVGKSKMPVIAFSSKGGTSVDSSDWLTKKKQRLLQSAYSSQPYKQVENKSFGSDTISTLLWKKCGNVCTGSSGPPILLSLIYVGSNYTACGNDPNRQSMTMTITATFNRPINSITNQNQNLNSLSPTLTINGNIATFTVPNGPNQRCTNASDANFPVTFIVDGIYTITTTLLIPANA